MNQLSLDLEQTAVMQRGYVNGGLAAMMEVGACQRRADTKAFTGRGRPGMQLRRERIVLEQIHAEMDSLSRLTRDVAGRVFYLQVHNRPEYGQKTLRWRTMGIKGVHIPWAELHQYFERELPQMNAWYEQVHTRVLELNALEKSLRQQIKTKEHIATFQ